MTTAMYKALAFVDERRPTDPGYLERLGLTPSEGYVPQSLSLGLPQVRSVMQVRPSRHGIDDMTMYFGARTVGLIVGLMAESVTGRYTEEELAERLMAWFHPAVRFRLMLAGGRSILVRGDSVDSDWNLADLEFHMLRCTMVAPEGVIESDQLFTETGTFGDEGFVVPGRQYSLDYDRRYPDVETGSGMSDLSCRNLGRITAYPLISFVGPVTNPALINVDTAERMQVNVTLLATDTLTVDMERHRVLLNGFPAYYQNIDFTRSTWWGLPPQKLTRVRFVGTNFGENSSGLVQWRNRFL